MGKKRIPKVAAVGTCPDGVPHSIMQDVEGFYCNRCLESVSVRQLKKQESRSCDDPTKLIAQIVRMTDDENKGNPCPAKHKACINALGQYLKSWTLWHTSST